jgi:ATP-dependent DNA helicase RecG
MPDFRFFDPWRDEALLATARTDAWAVIEADPELERGEHRRFRDELVHRYGDRARLYEVG